MSRSISDMGPDELVALVRQGGLSDPELLKVLRNPYCTLEIADEICSNRKHLKSFKVRELLAGFRGLPVAKAMNLISTLPWLSLLQLMKEPRTPPAIRRNAEQKLLSRLEMMTLGEKIAVARQAPRSLFRNLIRSGETEVLIALLDNPQLVENDVLLMLNTITPPRELIQEVSRHRKWGNYYGVRRALAECRHTPLPLALGAMVRLKRADLVAIKRRPGISEQVRSAAGQLLERKSSGREKIPTAEHED